MASNLSVAARLFPSFSRVRCTIPRDAPASSGTSCSQEHKAASSGTSCPQERKAASSGTSRPQERLKSRSRKLSRRSLSSNIPSCRNGFIRFVYGLKGARHGAHQREDTRHIVKVAFVGLFRCFVQVIDAGLEIDEDVVHVEKEDRFWHKWTIFICSH